MNVGPYSFAQFKQKAADFHGYPAPGLLIGGYMVELAKGLLPQGTLFDALVETPKCLPDAVQILSLCSIGNGWLKIKNLGRYALSLYDKYTGTGVRVWVDNAKLADWPEVRSWFFKLKPKKEQDAALLLDEIERAGTAFLSWRAVQVHPRFLKHKSLGEIEVCPICAEPYPASDGAICRACQGDDPYAPAQPADCEFKPRAVPAAQAVGKQLLHDMTQVLPGQVKGPAFTAGQVVSGGDVCRLERMGRNLVYLAGESEPGEDFVHENQAALSLAAALCGEGVVFCGPPREGKLDLKAGRDGLLLVDSRRLRALNSIEGVVCASRQNAQVVAQGKSVAGCRAVPLYLPRADFLRAMRVLEDGPLFNILPLVPLKVGILVTGTEVFKGLIEDRFIPVIRGKVEQYGCPVVAAEIAPDSSDDIAQAARRLCAAGAELVITTAGLSVDPEDLTRRGLCEAGLSEVIYGAPLLPGAMILLGRLGAARIIGVPACALYHKTTSFDILLPRVLAGLETNRADLARLGDGGLCHDCKTCTYPKCTFGK